MVTIPLILPKEEYLGCEMCYTSVIIEIYILEILPVTILGNDSFTEVSQHKRETIPVYKITLKVTLLNIKKI